MIPMQDEEMLFMTFVEETRRLMSQAATISEANYGRKLSRSEIAEKTGIDEDIIERIERGIYDPPIFMLMKILYVQGQALDVKPYHALEILSAKEFGETLTELRKRDGLTIEELGEQIEMTASDIEYWEKYADMGNDQLYIVSTPYSPPPEELREKLLKDFTEAEIDQASKVLLKALEILGIISLSPILPSPKYAKKVMQTYNHQAFD